MNRTDIEYLDWTWNPWTGCTKGCGYCWARKRATTRLKSLYLSNQMVHPECNPNDPFSPRYWPSRLNEPLSVRKASKIGVCFMGDLFDPHIPNEDIQLVIDKSSLCPRHTFLFLTKQPQRMAQFAFPDNAWCGVTIDGQERIYNQILLDKFYRVEARIKFISYEPLLGAPAKPLIGDLIQWIIIGAMTGKNATKPEAKWVENLLLYAQSWKIPIFLKNNLKWPERRQEYPKEG